MIQARDRGERELTEDERHLREFQRWGRGLEVVTTTGQKLTEAAWAVLHPDENAWRAWRRFAVRFPLAFYRLDGLHKEATDSLERFGEKQTPEHRLRLGAAMERLGRHVLDTADALEPAIRATDAKSESGVSTIPPDKRTKPMTKKRAARLLGRTGDENRAVEWLNACVDDGTIRYEKRSRQSGVYHRDDFPPEAQSAIAP